MQVAAFLSDLKTLSVCSHEAAMRLVTKHNSAVEKEVADSHKNAPSNDADLRQGEELLSLHENVKLKYLENGLDPDFIQAREEVGRILSEIEKD